MFLAAALFLPPQFPPDHPCDGCHAGKKRRHHGCHGHPEHRGHGRGSGGLAVPDSLVSDPNFHDCRGRVRRSDLAAEHDDRHGLTAHADAFLGEVCAPTCLRRDRVVGSRRVERRSGAVEHRDAISDDRDVLDVVLGGMHAVNESGQAVPTHPVGRIEIGYRGMR